MSRLSGKEALAELDTLLGRARSALTDVEQRYAQTRVTLAQLRRAEMGVYADLAKLRMRAIERGELLETLDHADRSVARMLEDRASAAAGLDERIEVANSRLAETEAARAAQSAVVSAASDALDAAEGAAQAQLSADAGYQAQLSVTEHADFVAEQAEAKAEAARRDRVEKGKPYEDDPLFSYLWNRGFGTSGYSAWPLTRWLDTAVASLCEYAAARRDYDLLIEIPERLREHAAAMRAAFETEVEALRDLETVAAEAADVPAHEARVENEEQKLAAIDAEITKQEEELRALVRERVQFANGNDSWYMRCIEVLRDAMRSQGFALLRERAARTQVPEDDALVHRLVELDGETGRIEQDLSDYQRMYARENQRLNEFEEVRRRFRSERFDGPRSEFVDAALFTLVLQRLLNGAVSSGDAWKAIRRQQRMRANRTDPRFGTRRFPGAPGSGPWRMPPGGGGFGGGGFGSGGGFGGGGFRSGGGF
ncbi:MAG: hypothetical protein PVF63_04670 [Gammaproteobacteria bacterium]|jgi:hypothetical protein